MSATHRLGVGEHLDDLGRELRQYRGDEQSRLHHQVLRVVAPCTRHRVRPVFCRIHVPLPDLEHVQIIVVSSVTSVVVDKGPEVGCDVHLRHHRSIRRLRIVTSAVRVSIQILYERTFPFSVPRIRVSRECWSQQAWSGRMSRFVLGERNVP